MQALEAGTISACVLALVILLLFCAYTWIKWRKNLSIPKEQDPEQARSPRNQERLKSDSFKEGTRNQAVSMPSMDNGIDKEREKAKEATEKRRENQDDVLSNERRRGESFRDHRTRQETTYL